MPIISKISAHPFGEYKVEFSNRTKKFRIQYSPELLTVSHKIQRINTDLKCWDDVEAEMKNIVHQALHEEKLLRKVIVIQLQTSASTYKETETDIIFGNRIRMGTEHPDLIDDVTGFLIRWFIAEEYQFAREKRYRVIEAHRNMRDGWYHQINILPQLFHSYHGKPRVLDYSEELHLFLKKLDDRFDEIMIALDKFFDRDNQKFLNNIVNSKLKLLQ